MHKTREGGRKLASLYPGCEAGEVARLTLHAITERYSSDLGSERFLGLFLSKSATSSRALGGAFTLPSRMISFAVSFCPYSFSLALPSERSVEPSSEIPANSSLEQPV